MAKKSKKDSTVIRCSFCYRTQGEVDRLISGPNVYICDECVKLCTEILIDEGIKFPNIHVPQEFDITELGIRPRFKTVKFKVRQDHCFHLSPFAEPFNTIYNDHIRRSVAEAGFSIERADEIFGTDPIIEDIWQAINSSTIVIADVTGRNPNVMYEIGMAHTVGRPVLIITQSMDDVPFDLKHYRCIVYEYTPRGCQELEHHITGTLRFLKGKRITG